MSWLSGSLSNFTGQISNFTKEVLTEGTEEVSDHATELKVASQKVKELEAYAYNQKVEIERLKKLLVECEERAESSELQVNHVSSEYRTQLQAKEAEIITWKQKYDEHAEQNKKLVSSSFHPSPVSESTNLYQQQFEVSSDGMDFSDVISSQHEINRLSEEVRRLQAECQHWKQIAQGQQTSSESFHNVSLDHGSDVTEMKHLHEQIKQLKEELNLEIENHQRELTSLHDVHAQKLATLKKKHKNEVESYEDKIQELQLHLDQGGHEGDSDMQKVLQLQGELRSSKQTIERLEERVKGLEGEVKHNRSELEEKARNLQRLGRQMEALQQDKKKLVIERDELLEKKTKAEKDLENVLKREAESHQKVQALQQELQRVTQHKAEKIRTLQLEVQKIGQLESEGREREVAVQQELHRVAQCEAEGRAKVAALQEELQRVVQWEKEGRAKIAALQNELQEKGQREGQTDLALQQEMVRIAQLEAEGRAKVAALQNELQEKGQREGQTDLALQQEMARITQLEAEGQAKVAALQQELEKVKTEADDSLVKSQEQTTQLQAALEASEKKMSDLQHEKSQVQTCETLHSIHEAKERIEVDMLHRQSEIVHEKSDIIDQMIRSDIQMHEQEEVVSALEADHDVSKTETLGMIQDIGSEEHQRLTGNLVNTLETENLVLKERVILLEEKVQALERCVERVTSEKKELDRIRTASSADHNTSIPKTSTPNPARSASVSGSTSTLVPPSANDTDTESIFSGHSELSLQNRQLDTHVKTLEGQIEDYEREIETFEMMKSDWQLEKEALEDVLLQLRKKLRQKEDSLNVVQAHKGLVELERSQRKTKRRQPKIQEEQASLDEDPDIEMDMTEEFRDDDFHEDNFSSDIEKLYHEVKLLTDSNALLENERDLLKVEKEKLLCEMKEQRVKNAELKENAAKVPEKATKHFKDELSSLSTQLQEKDQELLNVSLERDGLLSSLDELDGQHQQVVDQLLKTRDSLMKNNENLSHQVALLEDQLEDYERKLRDARQEREVLRVRCDDMLSEYNLLKRSREEVGDELEYTMKQKNSVLAEKQTLIRKLEGGLSDVRSEKSHIEMENERLKAELQRSTQESEVVRNLRSEVDQLVEQSQRFEDEARRVRDEKEGLGNEVMHLRDAAKENSQAFDELQMRKNDLEITMSVLEEEVADLQTKYQSLEMQNHELMQIHSDMTSRENVQTTGPESLNSTAIDFDKQLEGLRLELDSSLFSNHENLARIGELEKSLSEMESEVSSLSQERNSLKTTLESSQEKFRKELQVSSEKHQHSMEDLVTKVDALRSEKQSLEKELNSSEQKIQDLTKRYESYIQEMTESRQMDTSSLQLEVERVMKVSHEKDTKIVDLEMKCEQLDSDLEETKDMLQSSIDGQRPLKELITEREQELSLLKQENSHLLNEIEEKMKTVQEFHQQVELLKDVEKQLKSSRDEAQKLKNELYDLRSQQDSDRLDAKTLDVITDLETEISTLNSKLDQKDNEISHLHGMISEHKVGLSELTTAAGNHSRTAAESSERVRQFESRVLNLENDMKQKEVLVSSLNDELNEKCRLLQQEKQRGENLERCLHSGSNGVVLERVSHLGASNGDSGLEIIGVPNGDIRSEHEKDLETEMKEMRHVLKDKDSVIGELQTNNASLLRLLEDKAMSHGNNALLEIHKLQEQVKCQNIEKEHMMSVLTDKSRELSTLKSEVHRLMNVISAEKTAIEKLQQDNTELRKTRDDPNEDMTKSAIRTLSQLVRDREMEIEALKQKNDTLVQVLQEGGGGGGTGGGTELHNLIQEKENLTKQLTIYHNDREQIINALNQKHQESVSYHTELQRMTVYVTDVNEKQEKLQQDFDNLKQQYEDKQNSLLKAQNELVNYKHKYSELDESYREAVDKVGVSTIETKYYDEKCAEVLDLSEKMKQQDSVIHEKDKHIAELMQKIANIEDIVKTKESDIHNLKIQLEKLNFELNEIQIKLDDANTEISVSQKRTSDQESENTLLRESNNKLTMLLHEREYEVNGLKEKSQTLTRLVQEKGPANNEEMERVLRESETVQQQAQVFQQERDQMVLALRQRQDENVGLQAQLQALLEREQKLTKELDRLREHLLQIEEGYTQEALDAESREKELRNRLAMAEEKAASSSTAVESMNQQAHVQVETLQQQLHGVVEQRDQALYQVMEYQKQITQYAMSLQNLQMVLEQFQYEKEAHVKAEAEKYKTEVSQHEEKVMMMKKQMEDLELKLSEANEGLEAASRLSEQLDKKEEIIHALKEEVHLRESAAMNAEKEIEKLTSSSQEKVEKLIVKNLFLGYFTAPKGKQRDVIRLIGGVLNFNKEEMAKAGIDGAGGGWLSGWLGRSPKHSTPTHSSVDHSFSQMFVKFLESESTPKHKVALPAEEMALEQQHKHQRPAFNPFSAPRHAALPMTPGETQTRESHILINPASPVLPMFPPLVTSETPPLTSGRSSGTNSGRSTPSSGNILRDVLSH